MLFSKLCYFESKLYSQNLLPNPGFEIFLECPRDTNTLLEVADWFNISENAISSEYEDENWWARDYIHACDPKVDPFWNAELGDGVIALEYSLDPATNIIKSNLIWTSLQAPLQTDSLYYIEVTTAPVIQHYVPDDTFYEVWCVPNELGIRFEDQNFKDTLSSFSILEPNLRIENSGSKWFLDKLVLGNCYKANGSEAYFLYGHFRPSIYKPESCFADIRKNYWLGGAGFLTDNFRLEKMKAEICCDQTVCPNDQVDFSEYFGKYALKGERYVWNDGTEGLKRSFSQSGSYRLTLEMDCGAITSNSIQIEVKDCKSSVFVPSAFSPNGDGVNDNFKPYFSDDFEITAVQFSLFNRWGQQFFLSNQLDNLEWNGITNGKLASPGVYVFFLTYITNEGGELIAHFESGEVTLLR